MELVKGTEHSVLYLLKKNQQNKKVKINNKKILSLNIIDWHIYSDFKKYIAADRYKPHKMNADNVVELFERKRDVDL